MFITMVEKWNSEQFSIYTTHPNTLVHYTISINTHTTHQTNILKIEHVYIFMHSMNIPCIPNLHL